MNNAHAGVLQVASSTVTPTQIRLDTAKNNPSRSAHLRLRSCFARGSAAELSFCANTSDISAAVSIPRCISDRQASGLLVVERCLAANLASGYWPIGFSGVASGVEAGLAGAAVPCAPEAPPDGNASPRIEARICSSRECPAIWTVAC